MAPPLGSRRHAAPIRQQQHQQQPRTPQLVRALSTSSQQQQPLGPHKQLQQPRQRQRQQQQRCCSALLAPRGQAQFLVPAAGGRPQRLLLLVAAAVPQPEAAGSGDPSSSGGSEGGLDPNIPAVDQDFDLLGSEVKRLTGVLEEELKGCSIYLIGMMGSGKSTTGKMLANTLKYAFFDTDNVIERAHPGETVADIFSKYGEDYFRQCEEQVLKELAPYKSLVVATGGGAVTRPKNWSFLHNGIVAWLAGAPELLARRVVAEGLEKRPLLFGDGVSEGEAYDISLAKLTSLLEARTKYYENADVVVDLRGYGADEAMGAPAAVVMHRLMEAISKKIAATREEREARRTFTIERGGEVPSLRAQPSPAQQKQQPVAEE